MPGTSKKFNLKHLRKHLEGKGRFILRVSIGLEYLTLALPLAVCLEAEFFAASLFLCFSALLIVPKVVVELAEGEKERR